MYLSSQCIEDKPLSSTSSQPRAQFPGAVRVSLPAGPWNEKDLSFLVPRPKSNISGIKPKSNQTFLGSGPGCSKDDSANPGLA